MSDARQEIEQEVRQALESLRDIESPDSARQGAQRVVFMEQARRHAVTASAERRTAKRSSQRIFFPMQNLSRRKWAMAGAMLAVLLVLFAGGGGVIYAANSAVPGDPLYGLDQAVETTRLRLTSQPEAVVGLLLALAQERLEEAQALLEEGDLENLGAALEGYGTTVSSLATTLGQAEEDQVQELAGLVDVSFAAEASQPPSFSPALGAEIDQEEPGLEDEDYCTGTETHPVAMAIAESYSQDGADVAVMYAEIIRWFCDGNFGLGEIMLALETWDKIEAGVTTDGDRYADVGALIESRAEAGWGQIWQGLGLIGKGKASVGPPSAFPVGPSEVADVPAGPVRTGAELDDVEEWCVGADPHPVATRLAESYQDVVTYEEIMGWFCDQDFGLGEIKLALETADQLGPEVVTAEDLLDERATMGWGKIWQEHGLIGNGDDEDDNDGATEPGEDEDLMDDGAGYYCNSDGVRQHPVALRLSEMYADVVPSDADGDPYKTVMHWFCDERFGLGEIKLALEASEALSDETEPGLPDACADTDAATLAECLLALRESKGWGEVWHDLDFLGKPGKGKSIAAPDEANTLGIQEDEKAPPGLDKEKKPKLQKPAKPPKPAKPEKPAKPDKPDKPAKPAKPPKD